MTEKQDHKRVNDILLGPLERPALQWLAAHQPAWMNPDILTGIGILGAVLIFASYILTNIHPAFLWLASLGLVINWYGDSLDGTLARYRKIERPKYGFFVDHTVDAFDEMLVILGIGLSPYVRFDIAAMTLVGYLMMSVLVYIRTFVDGVFKISYGKIGPTELRLVIIITNTFIFFAGPLAFTLPVGTFTAFDVVCGGLAAALIIVFAVSSLQEARALAKLPERSQQPARRKQPRQKGAGKKTRRGLNLGASLTKH